MKEHESRKLEVGEIGYFYSKWSVNGIVELKVSDIITGTYYVDSKNFLHATDKIAWVSSYSSDYFIHGKICATKDDWEIERNRILMLEEI